VLPPWWRTWWAYALYIIVFIAALWSFIKWREKTIKKEAALKQQKTELEMQVLRTQMNPHFIFNSLNSISRFILKNQRIEANDYLTKFSKLIRMILHNSAMPTVKLANELNVLQLYLELECLRFDKKIMYEFQCDPDLDAELIEIPPLLLQPYIENAIWHGLMQKKEEGHLWIKIEQKGQYLVCTITDNGIGRKMADELKNVSVTKSKSMGMNTTSSRIALLNQSKQSRSDVKIIDRCIGRW
jgi:LytS/YehU family sensor histidine kinase